MAVGPSTIKRGISVNIYRPRTYVRCEVMFSQVCVCSTFWGGVPHLRSRWDGVPHLRSRGGTPSQVQGGTPSQVWGGTPSQVRGGTPSQFRGSTPSQVRGGNLGSPPPGIASTCYGYAAGGMPLAFMQEDFLVSSSYIISEINTINHRCRKSILKSRSQKHFNDVTCVEMY